MDSSLLLHTEVLSEFEEQYFAKVLDINNIVSDGVVNFPKVKATDGTDLEINFFGWVVNKGGVSYLIPNVDQDKNPVTVKDVFPLVPQQWEDVGYQSKAYRYVRSYSTVKYKSENRLGMRKLIDTLCNIPHSNPKHRKLLVMAIVSQVINRAYYRFSSPPGFGKDSIVDVLGLLVGRCATIENPSVPKLEREASVQTLCGLNEVVGLTRGQWTDIGKFMLAACAYKPKITKRTRAFGGVGEEINLRNFSMSLFYNDIDCYVDPKIVYFDSLAEGGILDRIPAFRLYGHFDYDFNSINSINVREYVKENWDTFLDIIYTLTYYKNNPISEIKYSYDLGKMPQRWKRSIGVLLRVVAEYCVSQQEFDAWVNVIKGSMLDYTAMIEYPKLLPSLKDKVGKKEFEDISVKLKNMNTYSERISFIVKRLSFKEEVSTGNRSLKVNW